MIKKDKISNPDLISKLRDLGPLFFERRLKSNKLRRLPEDNISDLIDSQVLKACQPISKIYIYSNLPALEK